MRAHAAGGCGAATCEPVVTVGFDNPSHVAPVIDYGTLFVHELGLTAFRWP